VFGDRDERAFSSAFYCASSQLCHPKHTAGVNSFRILRCLLRLLSSLFSRLEAPPSSPTLCLPGLSSGCLLSLAARNLLHFSSCASGPCAALPSARVFQSVPQLRSSGTSSFRFLRRCVIKPMIPRFSLLYLPEGVYLRYTLLEVLGVRFRFEECSSPPCGELLMSPFSFLARLRRSRTRFFLPIPR